MSNDNSGTYKFELPSDQQSEKKEVSYTKGPWTLGRIKKNEFNVDCQEINSSNTINLAQVHGMDPEAKANAELIARAPEMGKRIKELEDGLRNAQQVIESLIAGKRIVNLDEALAHYNTLLTKSKSL